MHGLELFSLLYICFILGIILYALSLLSRLVKSNERIAAAIEAAAARPTRDEK